MSQFSSSNIDPGKVEDGGNVHHEIAQLRITVSLIVGKPESAE